MNKREYLLSIYLYQVKTTIKSVMQLFSFISTSFKNFLMNEWDCTTCKYNGKSNLSEWCHCGFCVRRFAPISTLYSTLVSRVAMTQIFLNIIEVGITST